MGKTLTSRVPLVDHSSKSHISRIDANFFVGAGRDVLCGHVLISFFSLLITVFVVFSVFIYNTITILYLTSHNYSR